MLIQHTESSEQFIAINSVEHTTRMWLSTFMDLQMTVSDRCVVEPALTRLVKPVSRDSSEEDSVILLDTCLMKRLYVDTSLASSV